MHKQLLFFLLFIFAFLIGKTQGHLTILAKDSVTHETLPGVSVAFLNVPLGLSTDANGKAYFPKILENSYQIKLNYIGYKEKVISVEIPKDTLRIVFMSPARVWSGVDAKKIGLIDEFGGIKDAIALAAKKAKLTTYNILELPKQKEPFEEIMSDIFDQDGMIESKLQKELGSTYDNYKNLKNAMKYKGVQMRLPYDVVIY